MKTPTPTIDHTERTEPGKCPCGERNLCPACLARLQAFRHEADLQRFVVEFGSKPRVAARERPRLRLVK